MQWNALIALLAATSANALLRFGCSQLVTERLDPLVNPGVVGTPHLHQIVGGNAFNATMEPGEDYSTRATCTTCSFSEDFSNYWTAVLFFQHANGSYKRVKQVANLGVGNTEGGMTVYYIQGDFMRGVFSGRKVTPMRKGFRMLVGDPATRNMNTNSSEAKAISFRCFSAGKPEATNGPAPGGGISSGVDSYALPNKVCAGGIRSQVYFPTCWDGKNLDSPDHKSHVAFDTNGRCPTTHPTVLPQVLYEIIWDTTEFNNMWPTSGKNPFVWSMGDRSGLGQHADYLFGWKADALERAMARCDNASGAGCTTLKTQTAAIGNQCKVASKVGEATDGWLTSLPGNPVVDSK